MFKVITDSGQQRAALLSMLVASGAALIMVTAWYALAGPPAPQAVQRSINDVTLEWRCAAGHRFSAAGSLSDRPCTQCGEPACALVTYLCPTHGVLELEVRFGPPRRGQWPTVLAVRSEGGEWHKIDRSIACPQCGTEIQPAPVTWNLPQ
jgi:hypothetical protein